jgi:two-component SAPR family response regulator
MALEQFKVNCKDYAMILSDIRIPGMNGYELIRNAKEIDKQVKIVLMSAFEINDREFHKLLPDVKVDAFLQKPFYIQQLNDMVEKINIKVINLQQFMIIMKLPSIMVIILFVHRVGGEGLL